VLAELKNERKTIPFLTFAAKSNAVRKSESARPQDGGYNFYSDPALEMKTQRTSTSDIT
jgi:hypothetical protein